MSYHQGNNVVYLDHTIITLNKKETGKDIFTIQYVTFFYHLDESIHTHVLIYCAVTGNMCVSII